MMTVGWVLVVIFQVALCLRADSLIEWTYLQVFLPLFLFDAYLILWTGIGLASRAILEKRTIKIATVRYQKRNRINVPFSKANFWCRSLDRQDNLISKRQHDLLTSLTRRYEKMWSKQVEPRATLAQDLLLLLEDANRHLCSVPFDSVVFSSTDPEYGMKQDFWIMFHFSQFLTAWEQMWCCSLRTARSMRIRPCYNVAKVIGISSTLHYSPPMRTALLPRQRKPSKCGSAPTIPFRARIFSNV